MPNDTVLAADTGLPNRMTDLELIDELTLLGLRAQVLCFAILGAPSLSKDEQGVLSFLADDVLSDLRWITKAFNAEREIRNNEGANNDQ